MSLEEETELKDLIAQTLKSNGTFAKIKAQLRASIFLALDEDEKISKETPLLNNKIKTFMESIEGKSMFYIVHDFLEFFNLCYTLAVYEPESYLDCDYQKEEKQRIAQQFGVRSCEETSEPLLYQILKLAQKSNKNLELNINLNGNFVEENKSDSSYSTSESVSVTESICSGSINGQHSNGDRLGNENRIKEHNLNSTFNVIGSSLYSNVRGLDNNNDVQFHANTPKDLDRTYSKKHNDDTYDDTSSLPEDIVPVSQDKVTDSHNAVEETGSIEQTNDKQKLTSRKSEKLKSKSNLNSLSDLPPLNKSKVNDILPSLYNKDKSNLRELDKLFDTDIDYKEEDLMGIGDNLPLTTDRSTINLLQEMQESNNQPSKNYEKTGLMRKIEPKSKVSIAVVSDCNKTSQEALNEFSEVTSIVNANIQSSSQ